MTWLCGLGLSVPRLRHGYWGAAPEQSWAQPREVAHLQTWGVESSGTKQALTPRPLCKGMKLHEHRVPASSLARAGERRVMENNLEAAPECRWISL